MYASPLRYPRSLSPLLTPPAASPDAIATCSWPSAFWAMVAVYLSVLLQNGGAVGGLPFAHRAHLRSSPLVTAADTALSAIHLVWLWWAGGGRAPRAAARAVWYARFPEDPPGARAGSGGDAMWRLGMLAFALGSLPQAVKLFATAGLPGTQAAAAVALAAFVVTEALRFVAGEAHAVPPVGPSPPAVEAAEVWFRRLQRAVVWAAIAAQIIFSTWTVSTLIPSELIGEKRGWPREGYGPYRPGAGLLFVLFVPWCISLFIVVLAICFVILPVLRPLPALLGRYGLYPLPTLHPDGVLWLFWIGAGINVAWWVMITFTGEETYSDRFLSYTLEHGLPYVKFFIAAFGVLGIFQYL